MRISGRYSGAAWAAILLVALHVAVVIPHSAAHFALGIVPSAIDTAFIVLVIVIAPIVALPFVLRGSRAGIGLLDGGTTAEDYRAASIRERITVFHNTLIRNNHGISGALKNAIDFGSPPCSPQIPVLRSGFAARPRSVPILTSSPTPR